MLAIAAIFTLNLSYATTSVPVPAIVDAAVKSFTWDVRSTQRGPMMFLDIPYQHADSNETEYLTLTVAKEYARERPVFISVIVPDNIKKSNGIFLGFAKGKDNSVNDLVNLPIQNCTKESKNNFCTARIMDGFAINTKTKQTIDVFQDFMKFDQVYFMISYADGSHKSISVPLFSFKEQYKQLKNSSI